MLKEKMEAERQLNMFNMLKGNNNQAVQWGGKMNDNP